MSSHSASDLRRLYELSVDTLYAATQLHKAALQERGAGRTRQLRELVGQFYERLCAEAAAPWDEQMRFTESYRSATEALIALAGGAQDSPMTRVARYADQLKDILWPPGEGTLLLTSRPELSADDLKRALAALNGKGRATLRKLPVPDFDREQQEMQRELALVSQVSRLSDEGQAKALVDAARTPAGQPALANTPATGRGNGKGGRPKLSKDE